MAQTTAQAAAAMRAGQERFETAPELDDGETGSCFVDLAELQVLAYYEVNGGAGIEIQSISINGHEVPAYMFAADVLEAWTAEIVADRAHDERIHREAAEYEASEAFW